MSLEPKPPTPTNPTAAEAQAKFQQALAFHQQGQLTQAQAIYDELLQTFPKQADVLHLSGVIASQTGQYEKAVALIGRAIDLNPNNPVFHSNHGIALQGLQQFDAAVASYDKAIAIKPDHAAAYSNRGIALQGLEQFDAAVASYDKAIAIKPDYAEAYYNRGIAFQGLTQFVAAVASYDKAIAIKPDYVEAHTNRGIALHRLRQFDAAIASYDKAITIRPDFADAHYNRGVALKELKQLDAAVASYDKAVASRPDYAEAHYNRGNALQELQQYDAAVASYDQAIAIAPNYAEAHYNRGNALRELLRHDAAVASYDKAIAIKPDYTEAHKNRAVSHLLLGHFDQGWAEYLAPPPAVAVLKQRLVRDPHFKLLLCADQGLGDEIFFLRYLSALRRRGVTQVFYEGSGQLASILRRIDGLDMVITQGEPLPACDEALRISFLPLLTGETAPPPSLAVAPLEPRVSDMRERLAALGPAPYIGVTWRAGTPNMPDVLFKQAPLAQLGHTLAGSPGTLIAVQRLPKDGEIDTLATAAGKPVHDLTALNEDLEGMLALMALLDDYVTVSNTNVHLRALTGRVSRVLVPCPPDFRWMAEGGESPWFPGCRVYRQPADRLWDRVLADLRQDLRQTLL